jgi:hypothetical protein
MQRKHFALLCGRTFRDRSIAAASARAECSRSRTTCTLYNEGPSCVTALASGYYRHRCLENTLTQHQVPVYDVREDLQLTSIESSAH